MTVPSTLKAYPHLTPVAGTPPTANVQIGITDVNITTARPAVWPADFAYVLYKTNETRTRPSRLLFTTVAEVGWKMGSVIDLFKSVSMEHLGTYMIVGVKHGPTGEYAGQILDRLVKSCIAV